MKQVGNRKAAEYLAIDFLGYIFYPPSKRFVGENPEPELFASAKIKVAVFVDETLPEILKIIKARGIHTVQLHGGESPEMCRRLKTHGLTIIKAFNVGENFDFSATKNYAKAADYFLFDTKTALPGGSGKKFNWEMLDRYAGNIPFFLSGGIEPDDAPLIGKIVHPQFFGIDLNSGFEDEPGLKNMEKLRKFITEIKIESDFKTEN